MPTRDPRLNVLRRLSSMATSLMESSAYDPRPGQQPLRDRVMLAQLCFELGDTITMLGTRILDGEPLDASRELARRLVDLLCVAEGLEALPPGARTGLA